MNEPKPLEIRRNLRIYLVETDPKNPSHHGLHDNHAPFVLTTSPGRGDKIAHVLQGVIWSVVDDDGPRVVQFDLGIREISGGLHERLAIERDGGRAAMLGEDGWEEAFGGDALAELVPELLHHECPWRYAPVSVRILPDLRPTPGQPPSPSRRRWDRGADGYWREVEAARQKPQGSVAQDGPRMPVGGAS